jgi:hypothetical protein
VTTEERPEDAAPTAADLPAPVPEVPTHE